MLTRTFSSDKQRQRRPVVVRLDGAALRSLRLSMGLSYRKMASLLGKSPAYVWHLEDERMVPSVESAEDIIRILGTAAHESGALTLEWQ